MIGCSILVLVLMTSSSAAAYDLDKEAADFLAASEWGTGGGCTAVLAGGVAPGLAAAVHGSFPGAVVSAGHSNVGLGSAFFRARTTCAVAVAAAGGADLGWLAGALDLIPGKGLVRVGGDVGGNATGDASGLADFVRVYFRKGEGGE